MTDKKSNRKQWIIAFVCIGIVVSIILEIHLSYFAYGRFHIMSVAKCIFLTFAGVSFYKLMNHDVLGY